ncbi:MAG: carboxypeptidase M32 [Vicingaceae bacterium]
MNKLYQDFKKYLSKVADIENSLAILSWDQEVNMPKNGASFRAQQIATISAYAHELSTSTELGDLLEQLQSDDTLSFEEKRNIEKTAKKYNDNKKFDADFIKKYSYTVSECFNKWHQAKSESNFKIFAPHLKQLIELTKEKAAILNNGETLYDSLLDEYEPNMNVATLDPLFNNVKHQLTPFVKSIFDCKVPDDAFMYKHYPKQKQFDFTIELLKNIGYDFNSGRQDISTHPFSTSFNPQDVRITTRINENDLSEILWSSIHEGGHALYEQGLKAEHYGLPSGTYLSLSIHESQSRLYENNLGRSLAFWEFQFPKLQKTFPENLQNVSVQDFYKAMNLVKPSLIRTNADELTYHFHIMIRYEIEKAIINENIDVNELPELWNTMYKTYLNVDIPSDDKGILQDIHWSHGSFGYFPTYSLGSFFAAQFFNKFTLDYPTYETSFLKGDYSLLLDWLRTNIHQHGRIFDSNELCKKVTGENLNFKYFMDYAKSKYENLYELN